MIMVHLPDELAERVRAEAARRNMSVDDVVAELLATQLPARPASDGERADALAAFIGCADSGDPGWASRDIHELRAEAAARKLAHGA